MKKLSTKGMKALKVIHLVCAIAWFGSAISMNLLRHLVEVKDAAGMYYVRANAYAGLLQIVLLTVVTIVSAYKPWKRKGH